MGDHVNGFELMGSGELPRSCGLPDIFLARNGYLVLSPNISGTGPRISQRRSAIETCGQWEEMYNSPEDTVDYWGEFLIRNAFGWERVYRFRRKGDTSFFLFF